MIVKETSIKKEIEARDLNKLNSETPLIKEDKMKKTKNTIDQNTGNGNETFEMELRVVNIDSLIIPQHHPRSDYGNLEKLLDSTRRDGLQEPLLVYEIEAEKFSIIDGARRLKTVKKMGWKEVLCIIKKGISEADAAHLSYVKNVERKTLSVIEIALHIKTMKDEFDYTFNELELKGYGSPGAISNKLKLLDLPDKIQRQISDSTLTAAHGLALSKLKTPIEQENMAKRVVDSDLTAKTTERRIERYLSKKRKSKKVSPEKIIPSNDVPGVYLKDSRNMSELPDKSVQLIVSSPPYFAGMGFEKRITFKEHLANIQDVMKESARVLSPGGIIALNVADIVNFMGNNGKSDLKQIQLMGQLYQTSLKKYGIFLTDEIIWVKQSDWAKECSSIYKETTVHTSYKIFNNWESVYIFRKKGEREIPDEKIVLKSKLTKVQWMLYVNRLWKINPCMNNQEHPRMYPDELVKRLIRMFSYVGDTVLDPFLGSGTTVKVAKELGRIGIGYEKELQYKSIIMKKLEIPVDTQQPKTMMKYAEQMLNGVGSEGEKKVRECNVESFGRIDGINYSNSYVVPINPDVCCNKFTDITEGMPTNEVHKSEDVGGLKQLVPFEKSIKNKGLIPSYRYTCGLSLKMFHPLIPETHTNFWETKVKSKNDFPDKYRPRRISEIYGQKAIKKVLTKGIDEGSLPHSLMFYGPSGTGKTTLARIVGMGLNCKKGRSSEPCGECEVCKGVIQTSHLGYFEVNTANVTGIDYMRSLRGHFNSGTIDGSKNKIFVFDECQRLTIEAQTLLLKEVEDCVSSTYFIFCSTDREKILKTLRNRCMPFEFKGIEPKEMKCLLHNVCQNESVQGTPEILEEIIDESEGMVRNALYLLQHKIMLLT